MENKDKALARIAQLAKHLSSGADAAVATGVQDLTKERLGASFDSTLLQETWFGVDHVQMMVYFLLDTVLLNPATACSLSTNPTRSRTVFSSKSL